MRLRPSAPVWLFCAASLAVLTHRPAIAEQKLILDTGVVELPHGPIMGAEFQTRIPIPKFDWTSPVDYKNGQIYIRFDILARPSLKRFLALQFIQELIGGGSAGEHWWSSGNLRITEPRVYYTEHAIMDMVDATGLKLRLNDPPNLALSLAVQGAGGNPNSIWSDRFIYPMTVRITAVLVSRGATFSGWEAVLGPERPLIRPLGEPHALRDQPIEVTLTTGAQDAQIRYTLDGSEPTASSPLYRAPFVVEPPRTVKARTFKEGLPPSDVSSTNYTPPQFPRSMWCSSPTFWTTPGSWMWGAANWT